MSIRCGQLSHPFQFMSPAAGQVIRFVGRPFLLGVACLAVSVDAPAQDEPYTVGRVNTSTYESLGITDAVNAVLEHNPELAALDFQAQAMQTMPSQVGALPDPVLSLNAMNMPVDTFDLDQEAMTQMQVALSQTFPFPGSRKQNRIAREQEVLAAESMLFERRTALVGVTRSAWWRLFSLDRAIEIVAQNLELMRDFVEIAETKYRVGNGLQQDVLLAQLELSRLLDRELGLTGMRRGAQAKLNSLMNRPADWTITLPGSVPSTTLPAMPTETRLLQQAGSRRALIDAHTYLVEAARADLEMAKRDRYPQFRLGVGYGFRQGFDPMRGEDRPDLLSVMLSVNVPIFAGSKQSQAVEKQVFEISRRQHALGSTLRSVEASVSTYAAEYTAARDQVVLLETAIIPQAQQTVASMLAGYQVNQVDFLNVVNIQITLYNAQINYWDALSKAKQSLARLAAAVGEEALYE